MLLSGSFSDMNYRHMNKAGRRGKLSGFCFSCCRRITAVLFYIDKRRRDFYHSSAVFYNSRGVLAQLGERVVRNHEVVIGLFYRNAIFQGFSAL